MLSDTNGWLMLIYRVPSTPSTSRVMIWKKVKELGAYLLQQSVYVLPNIPRVQEAVKQLKEQIHHLGGESKIIEIASLGDEQEKEVISGFNNNREEEYAEVIKAGKELLQEIDEESKTEDFHFADLEENEKHIARVAELFENVSSRDYFGAASREKALELLKECQHRFEEFSNEVFTREGIVGDEKDASYPTTKHKERHSFSKKELVLRIRDLADKLDKSSFVIRNKKIGQIPESVVLEEEYKEEKGEQTLILKIQWASPREIKKSPKS